MTDDTTMQLSVEELNDLRRQILRARKGECDLPPPSRLKAALATLRAKRGEVQESSTAAKRAKKAEMHSKPLADILGLNKK